MATTLPVPITFRLPDGWQPVDPDQANAPGAAFVAVRHLADEDFLANIVVDGERRSDDIDMETIADESVERLRSERGDTSVVNRGVAESGAVRGYAQKLALSAVVNGTPMEVTQSQVYLPLDITVPGEQAIIRMSLTTSTERHPALMPDFLEFVGTVQPEDTPA